MTFLAKQVEDEDSDFSRQKTQMSNEVKNLFNIQAIKT
jgi:hypothetical protein